MRFKDDFLYNYLKNAPFALAVERSLECEVMSRYEFVPPVLDLGCGDGLFAFNLFDEKIDVGIDPNGRELRRAKEYRIHRELIQCRGDLIPKEAGSFNTVFCNSVLEHIPDFQSVLKEVYRLLSAGGRFYLTVPTEMFDKYTVSYRLLTSLGLNSLAERYRRFFNRFWRHFNSYKKEDWERSFRDCGFEIADFKECGSDVTCFVSDFLTPFAFPSFVVKKIINRWVLSPALRGIYIYPLYLITKNVIRRSESGSKGGIILFFLKKP